MNEQVEKALKIIPKDWRFKVQEMLSKRGVKIQARFVGMVVTAGYNHPHKIEVLKAFAEYTKTIIDSEKEIAEDLTATLAEV